MKINTRTNFLTLSLVTVIILCGIFFGAFLILNVSNNRNQESVIKTSRDWAGLNEFPENSQIIESKAEE
jgi:preprotein translocase subunit SecG